MAPAFPEPPTVPFESALLITNVSAPFPPVIVSAPVPPVMASSLFPPMTTNDPVVTAPASKTSFPLPPIPEPSTVSVPPLLNVELKVKVST